MFLLGTIDSDSDGEMLSVLLDKSLYFLCSVIDAICAEAPHANKRYKPDPRNLEELANARARAFIHLFLKVKFMKSLKEFIKIIFIKFQRNLLNIF